MISVEEAKKIVVNNSKRLSPLKLSLDEAAGLVLAEDVYASLDIPAFDQSSMDGYAFRFEDYHQNKTLIVNGEVPAGLTDHFVLQPQQAARIFTGAAVPEGADTVVMQEKISLENNQLIIHDEDLMKGNNVRPKGSEISKGSLALAKESFLSPAAIGFLTGMGVTEVNVYPKPSVSIIVTGKELQQPGKPLQHGQVYESNSFTLKAALHQLHIYNVITYSADDDPAILQNTLTQALQKADIVLLTGGVSVGDYDYVIKAASGCGVTQLFHKVKQKPGKPLYFGTRNNQLVFGLPGNPSSVLSCFYQYVIPALEKLTAQKNIIKIIRLPLGKPYTKKTGLTHFLKARHDDKQVIPLDAQESYRLSSFALADCLIKLEENKSDFKEGDMVEVHILS